MKNPLFAVLTALALVFSSGVVTAEDHSHDHKHEENDNHKKRHVEGDHKQHGDHVDHQEGSTDNHKEDHDHGDRATGKANERTKGEKQ